MLSVSLCLTTQGGERYIPADKAASVREQRVVYDYSQAYESQHPTEFLAHFTVGYKINRNRLAHEFSLKMINVTGSEEFGRYFYNSRTGGIEENRSAVSIPGISYKIEF
jgi:hypothetical protein